MANDKISSEQFYRRMAVDFALGNSELNERKIPDDFRELLERLVSGTITIEEIHSIKDEKFAHLKDEDSTCNSGCSVSYNGEKTNQEKTPDATNELFVWLTVTRNYELAMSFKSRLTGNS